MTYIYASGSFSRFKGFQSVPDATVDCIIQEPSGAFWFGLAPHHALRMDDKGEKLYDLSFGTLFGTIVNDIFQDKGGNIWFSLDRGLAIMHNGQLGFYDETQGLIDNNVNRVLEDREGNIWICTDRGGIQKLTLSKFRTVKTPSTINAIAEDPVRPLVWLGSDDGLLCYSYSDGSFHTNELTESAKDCRIRHVAFTRNGQLLVSSYSPQGQLRLTITGGDGADSLTCSSENWTEKDGLGSYKGCKTIGKVLAALFAAFCLLASFGIGNMTQVNSISGNMQTAFGVPTWVTGVVVMILVGLVVVGGLKRIAAVTEKIVPFMVILYMVGSIVIFITNISQIGAVFGAIFKGAFAAKSAAGGIVGYGIKLAIEQGMKRGVFSNEAGLGSSVMVHSNSNVKEPVKQGMWGIFEVFADTIVVCTLTAFSVLSSGLVNLTTGETVTEYAGVALNKANLVSTVFSIRFGWIGSAFIAVSIALFAFSTVLGWSHYGTKAAEYLLGEKNTIPYRILFVLLVFGGAVMGDNLAWDLADTFNGLMMIPNLIGVIALSGVVMKITKNYVNRTFHGSTEKPMYSAFPDVQAEQEARTDVAD